MKIKEPSARNRRITALKKRYVHYWLAPEKVKKTGRLSQRNKVNKKLRRRIGPSEFILMARKLEEQPYNLFNRR